MSDSEGILSNFRSMIRKFNDTTFLGEIVATIADAWDQSEDELAPTDQRTVKDAVKALSGAIEELSTFGEDDAEWPDWDSFLDFVHAQTWDTQRSMLRESATLLSDTNWINDVIELNRHRTDFAKAKAELERAITLVQDVKPLN
jgi:hypothetical protein